MRSSTIEETATGAALALIGFMLVFSAFPVPVQAATATGYLFTMTVVAPTSNPLRRQWAAIITNNLRTIGIDARLIYTSFGTMAGLSFGCSTANCGKTYDQGGFDAIFVGFGGGTPLPDFGTQNVVTYRSLTDSDFAPTGQNFIFYRNTTYNDLAVQYNNEFDAAARVPIAQRMVAIVAQDRPDLPIYQPVDVFGWANYINQWGVNASLSSVNVYGFDYHHWGLLGGHTEINVAVTGDINSVNQWVTTQSNTAYDAYLYRDTGALLEEVYGPTLSYYPALATSISGSSDHLTWTISFVPHTFHDGVPVTADDYLFGTLGSTSNAVGYVGAGVLQSLLGDFGSAGDCNCSQIQFNFLNGTSGYMVEGVYSHGAAPDGFTPTSVWTSVSANTFSFTLSDAYLFTDPVLTGGSAGPMHIFESIPQGLWAASPFATLHSEPFVYHWDAARYGGNTTLGVGTGTAYGPIGDGPYYYHGYDAVAQTGTLTKFNGYWNATGLESMGLFNAKVVHVTHITDKDQALAAFSNGQINMLDTNYQMNPADFTVLAANGGKVTQRANPSAGWQDFSPQNNHPIFGTGTATPLGQSDPTKAAFAARLVREAFSHAIPRQYIIDNLLGGIGEVSITEFCTCFAFAYPANVHPDAFDLALSKQLLAQAGYTTIGPGGVIRIENPPAVDCGTSPGAPGGSVDVPSFLLGNSLTLSGTFGITQAVGGDSGGWYTTLQESIDGGATWNPVSLYIATTGGYYSFTYTPTVTGDVWYRVFFTGIPATSNLGNTGPSTPSAPEGYAPPQAPDNGNAALNTTNTRYTEATALDIGKLTDVIAAALTSLSQTDAVAVYNATCDLADSTTSSINALAASTNQAITALQSSSASKTDLQSAVDSINGNITNVSYIAYAALAVAIILGLLAIAMARRKPS